MSASPNAGHATLSTEDDSCLEGLRQRELELEAQLQDIKKEIQSHQSKTTSTASSLLNLADLLGDILDDETSAKQSTSEVEYKDVGIEPNDSNDVIEEATTSDIKVEVAQLLQCIQDYPFPKFRLGKSTIMTQQQLENENQRRRRDPAPGHPTGMSSTGRKLTLADLTGTEVAPSVRVDPLPLGKIPNFDEVLNELGVPALVNVQGATKPLYIVDCRILTESLVKDLINKRAQTLLKKLESTKVDKGTQTYVVGVAKQYVAGCVNCKSRGHHFKECPMPFSPGFCRICGAVGFDYQDCPYPHGIEHELALDRCTGCSCHQSLYVAECPDCNIRWEGLVDWLRLNYATMATWLIPIEHRALVGENTNVLSRRIKAKFNQHNDGPSQLRKCLIRENALRESLPDNPNSAQIVNTLSEEKRQRAVQALLSPYADKSLDVIMAERPELQSPEEEIKIIVPTVFKKSSDR